MKELADDELFRALREGDKEALSILFLRHYDVLIHYGLRINAQRSLVEDCIQDLFAYLFGASSRLGDVKAVKIYLYKSLRRRLLTKIGEERKSKVNSAALLRTQIWFTIDDLPKAFQEDVPEHHMLLKALNVLPWRQREAIYLRYYNRLSTREISDIMGVANQTVLNTLYQALRNLRKSDHLQNLMG